VIAFASPADLIALALFAVCVLVYSRYADHGRSPNMLNTRMRSVRRRWVRQMLSRDDRVTDTILTGHSANAISFFASATILIVAGLVGVLSKTSDLYDVASHVILVQPSSLELFQFKLLGLTGIFIFGFYRFTWSLLQASYYYGLMGAAPRANSMSEADLDRLVDQISTVLNNVFTNFNGGIRTYYYALAWLGWLFQPAVFALATILITTVLIMRQFSSKSALAIRNFTEIVDAGDDGKR